MFLFAASPTFCLLQELNFLGFAVTEKEAALTIWEVDDDNDTAVDWEEFKTMFYRVRDDESGCDVELVEELKGAANALRMKQIKARGVKQFEEVRWEEPASA